MNYDEYIMNSFAENNRMPNIVKLQREKNDNKLCMCF